MFKQAIFIKHLPYIEEKIEQGYKLSEVVMLLKLEHNFDMKTTSNLSNYLCRFRNKLAAQTEKNAEEIIVKPSVHITQHQPQQQKQQQKQDDEIDIEAIRQLEAELASDKASILKPKSVLRKNEIISQSQDDEVDPKVLEQLKAKLEKDKKSMSLLVSKSLFDRS